MSKRAVFSCILTILALAAITTAQAEITVTTDKPSYEMGEIVQITAHNAGPEDEMFYSDPFFYIGNDDLNECVYGCVGLPVVTPFPAGETVAMGWDTGGMPFIPGNYSVAVVASNGAWASFVLTEIVGTEASSWSTVKALYR